MMNAYFEAIELLNRALVILDSLDEGVAAAHLSGVIDLVQSATASSTQRPH